MPPAALHGARPDANGPAWKRARIREPAARRLLVSLLAAVALHALLSLWRFRAPLEVPGTRAAEDLVVDELVAIDVAVAKLPDGPAPGGGSPEPVPKAGRRATPEQRIPSPVPAPTLPRAKQDRESTLLSEQPAEASTETEKPTEAPDVVTQASSYTNMASGPVGVPVKRVSATRTRVAQQASALSAIEGSGPGRDGGPGGRGAGFGTGNGVVRGRFQFGGPSGAFRAEVCFIPETTTSLKQLGRCRTEVIFYTDELDVSPRSFTEGFPGVTTRTEWFAIFYRGTFRVRRGDYYTFRLVSDDGALLYIDGYLVVDNDGQHQPAFKEATVPLAAGLHRLKVSYYQGPRDRIALQLFVQGSDGERRLLGPVL